MTKHKFNDTAGSILGLLQLGPPPGQRADWDGESMSAWTVWRTAAMSVSRFWNMTRSQVYVELNHLANLGLVNESPRRGSRGRRFYRITPAGRVAFRRWLRSLAVADDREEQIRSSTVLCVFFGDFLEKDALLARIDGERNRHRLRGEALEALLSHLANDDSLPTAVARRGREYHALMEAWLSDVEAKIAARPG